MKIDKLGNYILEVSLRNKQLSTSDVFSVTNSQGFIKSTDYFTKEVFSKNISNYKVVCEKEFAYNPSRINVGSIDYLKRKEKVAISPLYVVFKCVAELNEEYLKLFLKSPIGNLRIKSKTKGAVRDTLSFGSLSEIKIPIPPLTDQIGIAAILSKAESLISQRKECIRLLDELLKSAFLEMFGDPEKNPKKLTFTELEKLCTVIVDCPHSTPIKAKQNTNFPCIRTSELTDGYISWGSMQYLDHNEYVKRTQRLLPKEGDIVYGREGTYGDAVRIPAIYKFSLGQRTMLFRPDYQKTNSIFLWAMVRSDFVYKQAKKKNNGSTVGHINVKDIKRFKVYNPPIELQKEFEMVVEKIESLKDQNQISLIELENMYGVLSQKAFKGELKMKEVMNA